MRTYTLKDTHEVVGEKCAHCPRRLRVGQVVLHHHFQDNAWHNADFVVHIECVQRVVARAPAGRPSRRIEIQRQRIRETGRVLEPTG